MKICVYAIAKNEIDNVDRFMNSVKDADMVIVADTGSTDGTQDRLRELGATVYDIKVEPFRFDEARNKALSFVPDDVDMCFCLDLDEEIIFPEWRDQVEYAWEESEGKINKIYYLCQYASNLTQSAYSIHSRHDYVWKNRAHEYLEYVHDASIKNEYLCSFRKVFVQHHKDETKDRSFYFDLLKLDYQENPKNIHSLFNYARELYHRGEYDESIDLLNQLLSLTISNERFQEIAELATRFLSLCYSEKGDPNNALRFSMMSCSIVSSKESWIHLARISYQMERWNLAQMACVSCIEEENLGTFCSVINNIFEPWEMLISSYFNMEMYGPCMRIIDKAIELFNDDKVLVSKLHTNYMVCYNKLLDTNKIWSA